MERMHHVTVTTTMTDVMCRFDMLRRGQTRPVVVEVNQIQNSTIFLFSLNYY